jgi:tetratricopeptide (TPR) repeat protein
MKTLSLLIIAFFSWLPFSFAQAEKLKALYEQQKYDEVIKYKPGANEDLSAKSFYYIGMAYYMKEDDRNALKYLDQAIAKGPADHDMYFYKGMILFFMKKYEEALPFVDNAIALLPEEPDFYGAKGEILNLLKRTDSAIVYLTKATSYQRCKPRYYLTLADIYQSLDRNVDALVVFKTAAERLPVGETDHQTFSYNTGLMQQLTGDSIAARASFEKHIIQYPDDYRAIAKLIQVYYSLEEYEKAKPLKAALYGAHKKNVLPEGMEKMFCFHQFYWKGKKIMAFEHFDEPGQEPIFVKHNFYVMKDDGTVDYQVRSESSAAVRMTPNGKYVLCLVRNSSFSTFWNYVFTDDYKYPELKKAVLDILNKAVQPSAKTTINN